MAEVYPRWRLESNHNPTPIATTQGQIVGLVALIDTTGMPQEAVVILPQTGVPVSCVAAQIPTDCRAGEQIQIPQVGGMLSAPRNRLR
jgi:hypothetical protein